MAATTHEDIEKQIREMQAKRAALGGAQGDKVALGAAGAFDTDIYQAPARDVSGYVDSIAADDAMEDEEVVVGGNKRTSYTAPKELLDARTDGTDDVDPFADTRRKRIADREDEYHARRMHRMLSPERVDAFAGGKTPDVSIRTYKDAMADVALSRDKQEVIRKLKEKAEDGTLVAVEQPLKPAASAAAAGGAPPAKRRRWDEPTPMHVPEGRWLPHSAHGCRICRILHEGGNAHPRA
eukprot:Opistho-2@9895